MRARAAARAAAAELARAGIPEAQFEAEFLLRQAAGLSRARYFTDPDLDPAAEDAFAHLVARRLNREPAAYLAGSREFYGLEFDLSPAVLVPRPETELLVEIALREAGGAPCLVVDIGTGSGCIAVAVARNAPAARVVAVDRSRDALFVARRNARKHAVVVGFAVSDLASAIGRADVVLANLPYIPSGEVAELEPEVAFWEPAIALDGGADGLALVRRLIDDCALRLRPRLLALEVGYGQAGATAQWARDRGAIVEVHHDLAGIEREVCCRWT